MSKLVPAKPFASLQGFISLERLLTSSVLAVLFFLVKWRMDRGFIQSFTERGQELKISPEHPYFRFLTEEKDYLGSQYVYFILGCFVMIYAVLWLADVFARYRTTPKPIVETQL